MYIYTDTSTIMQIFIKSSPPIYRYHHFTHRFTYSPFSGNGILARSMVKALLRLGCRVTVWCCKPAVTSQVGLGCGAADSMVIFHG